MAYTEEQLRRYNTKPSNSQSYSTVEFYNEIAGYRRIVAASEFGPYKNMQFDVDGTMQEFIAAIAEVPKVTSQDMNSDTLGSLKFARISTQTREYLQLIIDGALRPADKIISVKLSVYEDPTASPIYTRDVYVGLGGVVIGADDVGVTLEFENPSKVKYTKFYNPSEYTSLQYG